MSYRIMTGNFKGGTGKSTNACLFAYTLAKKGYKTLLLDLDPQADTTKLMFLTKHNLTDEELEYKTTFMQSIAKGDLEPIITPITENLFILPSAPDFRHFGRYLEGEFPADFYSRGLVINKLLNKLEEKYEFDYILIDTPPTISEYTDNAVLSADGIVIVLQTQERSLEGAMTFVEYLQEVYNNYRKDFNIIGILPVMNKKDASTDLEIMKRAVNEFGKENMFDIIVPHFERLKRWDITGIQDIGNESYDIHDERTLAFYDMLTDELLKRIDMVEKEG